MYLVYETATGRAYSIGSLEPTDLPEHLAYKDVGDASFNTHNWNEETLEFELRPPATTHIISRRTYLARIGIQRVGMLQVIRTTTSDMNIKAALEAFQLILSVSPDVDLTFSETIEGTHAIADILEGAGALPEGKSEFIAMMLEPELVSNE